jgi:hypothetical protein
VAAGAAPRRASDNPFTARMRLHQSWYRDAVLRLPPGTGPFVSSTEVRGSMLRAQDAERGSNFLTPEIDCLPPEQTDVEAFHALEQTVVSGQLMQPRRATDVEAQAEAMTPTI